MKCKIVTLIACHFYIVSSISLAQQPGYDQPLQCDTPPLPNCDSASFDAHSYQIQHVPTHQAQPGQRCNCAACCRTDNRTHIYITQEQLAALAHKDNAVTTRTPVEAQGAFVAPPPVGSTVVEGSSFGIRGLALSFPEIRLGLPSLELPSLFRIRHSNRMRIEAASAPYVNSAQLAQQAMTAHQATIGQMGVAAVPQLYGVVQPTANMVVPQMQANAAMVRQYAQPQPPPQQPQYDTRGPQAGCDQLPQLPQPPAVVPNQEIDALRQQLLECQQLISVLGNKVKEQNAYIEGTVKAPTNKFRNQ